MQNNQSIFKQPSRELAKLGSRERKRLADKVCKKSKKQATTRIFKHIARGTTTGNYFDTYILNTATTSSNAPDKIAKLNRKLKNQNLQIERLTPLDGWNTKQHAWVLVKAVEVQPC
ncbi:hypothetical protein OAT97_00690 [Gammaproteobacteria bacterium]|nr:hypothetical protein [Gammaproteobacteria bacterium]